MLQQVRKDNAFESPSLEAAYHLGVEDVSGEIDTFILLQIAVNDLHARRAQGRKQFPLDVGLDYFPEVAGRRTEVQ